MHNELITIGPITLYGYGLMIAIGILAAYFLGEYRAKKSGLDSDMIFRLVIWCIIAGFTGSKILYFITILPKVIEDPSLLTSLSSGWVVLGGIIGGILGGYLCCRFYKVRFILYFDLVMPLVALAQAFGRIGCLLAGCCYGQETDSWFHIVFHDSKFAPNDVALVPTQIISSALDFILFLGLSILAKKTKKPGLVAAAYLICYSIGRFILEFYRGDLVRGSVGILSTSQFIGIFTCLAGFILLFFSLRKKATEDIE